MLLQKFYDEASQEVMKERYAPPQVEDYCTEYDGNYKIPGFEVEKEPFKKFPEVRYILHQYLFFTNFNWYCSKITTQFYIILRQKTFYGDCIFLSRGEWRRRAHHSLGKLPHAVCTTLNLCF